MRGHGEGSIYQRRGDKRWAASMTVGQGRKRKTFYGKTRREVQEKLKQALHEQQQQTLATGKPERMKDYLQHWLEEVKRPMVKVASYVSYRKVVDTYLVPSFGRLSVQALTPQHIQRFYTEQREAGLAPATIRGIHTVLRMALETAVRWNIIPRNPCDAVSLPRRVPYEGRALTGEQARQLLAATQTASAWYVKPLVTLAITTGLREGELLGLHWTDIDVNGHQLVVRRTVAQIGDMGILESTPKTKQSHAVVALPEIALLALAELPRHDSGVVFCRPDGRYLARSSVQRAFKHVLRKAGLPDMRFHDLRHSAATLLMEMGVHPKVVQEILRHSTFRQTMDTYSHVDPKMQADAMDKWSEIFAQQEDL